MNFNNIVFYGKPFEYVLEDGVLHYKYKTYNVSNHRFGVGKFVVSVIALVGVSIKQSETVSEWICVIDGSLFKLTEFYIGYNSGVYIDGLGDELFKYVTDYVSNI